MIHPRHCLYLLCLAMVAVLLISCGGPAPPEPPPPPPVPPMGAMLEGEAIWYGEMFHGRRTTSGQAFDMSQLTGSHGSLPMGTVVEVTSLDTNQVVEVVINDRSHLEDGNALALSQAAAKALGVYPRRAFPVRYRWVR